MAHVQALIAPFADPAIAPDCLWLPPMRSAEAGFRSRAKMAVSGTANAPVFGLPGQGTGADLSDCPLYPPTVQGLLDDVKALVRRAQVPPYDVARRRGELKNVIVTVAADGGLMLQLVLRSDSALPRLREHLPRLLAAQPALRVVSANLHPRHAAVLTGAQERHLAGEHTLAMPTGDVVLHARPASFVQTNTQVAGELYRQAARWAREIAPQRVWDLYCGLGGFALHLALALPQARITGVEVSAEAIDGARASARALGIDGADEALPRKSDSALMYDSDDAPERRSGADAASPAHGRAEFFAEDATAWARRSLDREGPPDLLVVNPPRRGLGEDLCALIEDTGGEHVVYSSCHPGTLAADLARMPSLRVQAGRYADMFPHTEHAEVIVLLRRQGASRHRSEGMGGKA